MNNLYKEMVRKPGDLCFEVSLESDKGLTMTDLSFALKFFVYGHPKNVCIHKDDLEVVEGKYYAVLNEHGFVNGVLFCEAEIVETINGINRIVSVRSNTGYMIGNCCQPSVDTSSCAHGYSLSLYKVEYVPQPIDPNPEEDQLVAEELFGERLSLPELTADRAIADEHGNRIADTYETRQAVRNHIRAVYNEQFIENPPLILDEYITPGMLSEGVKDMLSKAGATITNVPDGEDLTTKQGVLKLSDKPYNPGAYSGLGRVYLRKNLVGGQNLLTQAMVSKPNTIYILQYDYTLDGKSITIPEGCVLSYEGGSIRDGRINYTDTLIEGVERTNNVITTGVNHYLSVPVDEEDITSSNGKILKFKDKDYLPEMASGMGRVYLRKNFVNGKNILTQELINKPNTIYIIQYDYDLNGAEITIPEGCVLDFQGGSFSNGKLILDNTYISGLIKFNAVRAEGSIKNKEIYSSYIQGNNRAGLLSSWSSLGSLLIVDTEEILNDTLVLQGNIRCLNVIKFVADNLEKAVSISKEFDVENLSIDCAGVSNCLMGVMIDKQYDTTKKCYYNINVKNIHNNTFGDLSAVGCCFVQWGDSDFNQFNIDIKGRIENIHSSTDNIVGNAGGGATGLLISINNNQQGQVIDIHDMYIYNVVEIGGIVEDSDGIAILCNDSSEGYLNKVNIYNCTVKYCGRRNIKAQIPGLHIYDCLLDLDFTDGNDDICSQIAIGVQAKNIQIENCRIVRKSVSGSYGIHINNSDNCKINNVFLNMNGFNQIHAEYNCRNLNIHANIYSSSIKSEENPASERATCILTNGIITGVVKLNVDAEKYTGFGSHNMRGENNLLVTVSGLCANGCHINNSSGITIKDCVIKTTKSSVLVSASSDLDITNNKFYCSKCFSTSSGNTCRIKFIDNIVESYDNVLSYPVLVFGRCSDVLIKSNYIKTTTTKTYAINCFEMSNIDIVENRIHSDYNCISMGGSLYSLISNIFSGDFSKYLETDNAEDNYYLYNNSIVNSDIKIKGQLRYSPSANKVLMWGGSAWVDTAGAEV